MGPRLCPAPHQNTDPGISQATFARSLFSSLYPHVNPLRRTIHVHLNTRGDPEGSDFPSIRPPTTWFCHISCLFNFIFTFTLHP